MGCILDMSPGCNKLVVRSVVMAGGQRVVGVFGKCSGVGWLAVVRSSASQQRHACGAGRGTLVPAGCCILLAGKRGEALDAGVLVFGAPAAAEMFCEVIG